MPGGGRSALALALAWALAAGAWLLAVARQRPLVAGDGAHPAAHTSVRILSLLVLPLFSVVAPLRGAADPAPAIAAPALRARGLTACTDDDRMRRIAVTVIPRSGVSLTERMAYDNKDRLIQRTDAAGRRTFLVYDMLDQVVRTVQERVAGAVPANTYDARGLLVQEVLPGPSGGTRTYDAAGRLLTQAQKPTPVATGGN